MMRIFMLFFVAVCLGLVVFAQNYDSNNIMPNSNSCTGGACRIDIMKENNFFQQEASHTSLPLDSSYSSNSSHNRGGLNNSGNFTYDFNCQFGNCLPNPSGSYQP